MNANQKDDLHVSRFYFEKVINDLISLHNNLGYDVENQIKNLNYGLNALFDGLCENKRYNIEKNEHGDIIRRKVY